VKQRCLKVVLVGFSAFRKGIVQQFVQHLA
jgi:hypothetical protein